VQNDIDRDELRGRARQLGGTMSEILREEFDEHPFVGDIRVRGLFAAIELVSDRATRAGFENRRALPDDLRLAAMAEGLICYPGGILIDGKTVPHVLLAPPMIATDQNLEEGVRKLSKALGKVL
jgi:adenosylmethionine-8-amino-7-oxononanoate aminotransferase